MIEEELLELKSLKLIQESGFSSSFKLALAYKNATDVFAEIKDKFCDIFPQTSDIRFKKADFSGFPEEVYMLELRERNVDNWISAPLSSGMIRTLLHLAQIHLWPAGTVFLVDEFENSLGVNCINAVTEGLFERHGQLQFIMTSHHPYVINNIPMEYWKIVTREGNRVTVKNPDEFNLGRSKHEAFLQLANVLDDLAE